MSDNTPFKVRLPVELRAKLDAAALQNNRSVTAEMVHRLEESFSRPAPSALEQLTLDLQGRLTSLDKQVSELRGMQEWLEPFRGQLRELVSRKKPALPGRALKPPSPKQRKR